MKAISRVFNSLASADEGAYIPYICCGDMGREFTLQLIDRCQKAGADIIELGLPFSDPLADGPTIQAAMMRSLSSGFKVADLFTTVADARAAGTKLPFVLMTYCNPIIRIGVEEFCSRLASVGGDAILPVDMPIEESGPLDRAAEDNGLDVIRLIAPTTADERAGMILSRTTGFAYAVSVSGVTGERDTLPESALALIRRLRGLSEVPIALGFGISTADHVRAALSAGASGVVEGSALMNLYSRHGLGTPEALDYVEAHAKDLKKATRATVR